MPVIMTTPISDMTLSVVCVRSRNDDDAGDAGRNGEQDDERIDEGGELRHQDQVDEHDGEEQADAEALEGLAHALTEPRIVTRTFCGQLGAGDDRVHCGGDAAEVFAGGRDVDVDDAAQLVVVDLGGESMRFDVGDGVELGGVLPVGGAEGNLFQIVERLDLRSRDTGR